MTTLSELMDSHGLFLIDAYGVLVTSQGALPGAREFIASLQNRGIPFFVLTNDASRLPETAASYYVQSGLNIPVERVLTAGLMIEEAFRRHSLENPRCVVLGTPDTHEYVKRAGGSCLSPMDDIEYDALIVGDDSGFETLPVLNAVLSSLHRMIKRGKIPLLFLPNPDFLYPRGPSRFGFTSGSLAHLLRMGLRQLHPDLALEFEVLGKPSPLLYEIALERSGQRPDAAAMLGDQLHTDIQGANRAGVTSVLLGSGITQIPLPGGLPPDHIPQFILPGLSSSPSK